MKLWDAFDLWTFEMDLNQYISTLDVIVVVTLNNMLDLLLPERRARRGKVRSRATGGKVTTLFFPGALQETYSRRM